MINRKKKNGADDSLVAVAREEFDRLTTELAEANEAIGLYQFQIRKLRQDIEHVKLRHVLTNLGGPAAMPDVSPEPESASSVTDEQPKPVPGPDGFESPDYEDILEYLMQTVEKSESEALFEEWYAEKPAELPARQTRASIETVPEEGPGDAAASQEDETDAVATASAEPETAPEPMPDIEAIQSNMKTALDTISVLMGFVDAAREDIRNRDTLIELLKDKVSIEQRKIETGFVPAEKAAELQAALEESKRLIGNLELEIKIKGETGDMLAAEREKAESLESMLSEARKITSALEAEKAKLEETLAEMQSRIEALSGEARIEADAEVMKMRAELEEAGRKRMAAERELTSETRRMFIEKEELTARIDGMINEKEKTESELIVMLRAENAKLTAAVTDLRQEIEARSIDLEEEISKYRKQIDAMNDENRKSEEENETAAARIKEKHAADIRALEEKLAQAAEAHTAEADELKKRIEDVEAGREQAARAAEDRVAFHSERLMREMAELSATAGEREEKLRNLTVELEEAKRENTRIRQVNFELAARIKAAKKSTPDTAAAGFLEKKKSLLDKFSGDSSPSTLLELRELFIGAKKFDEAVRTFRQLLIEPKNQKFMPAVCLLVGEFYNLAGRTEEASFYLANPLIREDSFAQRLLDKIDIEVPGMN